MAFFKKDFSRFASYEILAGHSVPFAATFTSEFVKFSPASANSGGDVFRECLAFATAVLGMKLQSEYKIRSEAEMKHFFKRLVRVYEDIAQAQASPTSSQLKQLVADTLDPEFVELFGIYGARDYTAFATDEAFRNFVKMTNRSWTLIGGTSTVLATVMLQYRILEILNRVEISHATLNGVLMFSQMACDLFSRDCFRGAMN